MTTNQEIADLLDDTAVMLMEVGASHDHFRVLHLRKVAKELRDRPKEGRVLL